MQYGLGVYFVQVRLRSVHIDNSIAIAGACAQGCPALGTAPGEPQELRSSRGIRVDLVRLYDSPGAVLGLRSGHAGGLLDLEFQRLGEPPDDFHLHLGKRAGPPWEPRAGKGGHPDRVIQNSL
jgi:hypothetical protein